MAKKTDVELARVVTRGSVSKFAIICATVLIGLAMVCYTIIRVTEKPPWLVFMLAIVAVIPSLSTLLGIVVWLRTRYIAKYHRHRVELEKRLDPARRSSER